MRRTIIGFVVDVAFSIAIGMGCYQAGMNEGQRRGCTMASWNTISEYDQAVEDCKRRYP